MSDSYNSRLWRRCHKSNYKAIIEFVNHSDSSQQKLYIKIIDKDTYESWGSKTIELKVLKTNLGEEQPIHSVYSESPLSKIYNLFKKCFSLDKDYYNEFRFDQSCNDTIRVSCGNHRTLDFKLILESNGINKTKFSKKKIKNRLESIENTMDKMKGDMKYEISQLEDTIDEMGSEISKLENSILELTTALENKSLNVMSTNN